MVERLEDAIVLLRGAIRAADWEDLEQAQELVNDARSACDQWLALRRAHHGTSQDGETTSTAARAD